MPTCFLCVPVSLIVCVRVCVCVCVCMPGSAQAHGLREKTASQRAGTSLSDPLRVCIFVCAYVFACVVCVGTSLSHFMCVCVCARARALCLNGIVQIVEVVNMLQIGTTWVLLCV